MIEVDCGSSFGRAAMIVLLAALAACGGGGSSEPGTAGGATGGTEAGATSAAPSTAQPQTTAAQNSEPQTNPSQTQAAAKGNRAQIIQYMNEHCPDGSKDTVFYGKEFLPHVGKCIVGSYQGEEPGLSPTKKCSATIAEDMSLTFVLDGKTLGTFPAPSDGLYNKYKYTDGSGFSMQWGAAKMDGSGSQVLGTDPNFLFQIWRDPEEGDVPVIEVSKYKTDGQMEFGHSCLINSGTPVGIKTSL
ncbi:hypothetical protein [Lautropia dentalis]|uniref:hypothetical protein n=1 Tax=Lautropia dentalis TaxID=2490857 RepID=UPI00193A6C5D|nr:hypothetical protein [Lautropia dentalis]